MTSATATPSAEVVCAVEYPLLDMLLDGSVVVLMLDIAAGTEYLFVHGPGVIGFAYLLADRPEETGGAYLLADNLGGAGVAYLLADNPEDVGPRDLLLSTLEGCCVGAVWFFPLEERSLDAAGAYLLAFNPPVPVFMELGISVPTCTVGASLWSWLGGAVVHLSSTVDIAFGTEAGLGNAVFSGVLETFRWSAILFQWFFEASGTVLVVSLTGGDLIGRAALRIEVLGRATVEEMVVSLGTAELDLEADRDVAAEAEVLCISTGFA